MYNILDYTDELAKKIEFRKQQTKHLEEARAFGSKTKADDRYSYVKEN